jgi:hypothetical protein
MTMRRLIHRELGSVSVEVIIIKDWLQCRIFALLELTFTETSSSARDAI